MSEENKQKENTSETNSDKESDADISRVLNIKRKLSKQV